MSSSEEDHGYPLLQRALSQIGRRFPSLRSCAATLKKESLLLFAICKFISPPNYTDVHARILSLEEMFYCNKMTSSTPKATVDSLITDCKLGLKYIKLAVKGQYAVHLEKEYNRDDILGVWAFVDELEDFQREIVDEEAVTSVQNLRTYLDLTKHLAEVCESNKALVNEIWKHARAVADHTAIFLYSWLIEKDADLQLIGHNLTLAQLLQMSDPTQGANSLYLKIFHSLGLSNDTLPGELDTDEMSLIDHLLLCVDNRITHYQECHDGFRVDKLVAYETLVKASVSYSPLYDKIILCRSIITYATAVLPSSVSIDSQEKNMDESFDELVDKLVNSGFIGHLLHYDHKSLKGQLKELCECMSLVNAIVSYLRQIHMFKKIIFQKFIVKLVVTASSLSSTPSCCSFWRHVFPFHCFPSPNDIGKQNLIDVYKISIQNLIYYSKYEVIGEQAIGQYIDGLEEVQKQCLSSNTQAIISVQNLRSFQHLGKVIVNWYKNEDLLNNLKTQLLLVVERTTIFLCSCWLEPEKNQELKLTQLLQMTNIVNAKVHNIYVQGFKTLTLSIDSPWTNELARASFIDHMHLYLRALIQCQTRSLVASLKERLENLHGFLTALKNTDPGKDSVPSSRHQYINPSKMRAFHSVLIKFARTMATISITDSEDGGKENLALLLDLEEKCTLMKTEIRNSTIIDYPFIGFEFKSFFENLKEMLTLRTDLISHWEHEFCTVYTEMLKLSSFLERMKDKRIENKEQVKDLQRRIIQVSHKADFIIQSYVNREGPPYYPALQLSVLTEDIQLLTTEIKGYDTNDSSYGSTEEKYEQRSSEGSTSTITDMMVGFDDQSQAILEHLTRNSENRNIVAIVGMPGLGKTTIAKKVYNHPSALKFHLRAWCCVSQSYHKKELLLQILRSITEVNDDLILKESDDEIAAMLFKCLKKRRYLIVMDDVWETKAWEDLERSLPDDSNQSRVIITSRNDGVARTLIQATPHSNVHSLREFHDSESYKLLQYQLFFEDRFPIELSDAGMMIAKKCKGLPLAVVLAAGILSRMEKTEDNWINFGESLSTQIVNEAGNQCKALIDLSYTHLPDHLKCCFLYFGAFPEDKEISARKLARLWIAEGFVRDANSERLEDIAEHYLKDLIGRSLVMGSKSVSRPGIKYCHVHDLVRDFCVTKAEEENFLQVVRGYKKKKSPDTNHFEEGVDPEVPQDPSNITHLQYRLSIYSKRNHFIKAEPFGPNVRTLFFHALVDMYPNRPYNASFMSRYFKLIKVLDLQSINIGVSISGVALMLHLRYLALKGDIESVPTTIENLRSLETFILKGLRDVVISVPNSIWGLLRLRHLHIDDRISINLDSRGVANSAILPDMESFSTPTIAYGDDVEKLLRRLQNLRKLKCIFLDSWNNSEECNWFPMLEFLTQLVSLKVSWNYKSFSSSLWPCRFSFPSNLTKLTLSEFGLPWSEISAIGKLPRLHSLKLLSRAFSGKTWEMSKGEFTALKYLKLESLDIKVWSASDEHIPKLERLMFSKCERLKEIPSEIGNINTLEIIEVRWCNPSAVNSARMIQKIAKEDYGNDTPNVLVYPNEENPGASS